MVPPNPATGIAEVAVDGAESGLVVLAPEATAGQASVAADHPGRPQQQVQNLTVNATALCVKIMAMTLLNAG